MTITWEEARGRVKDIERERQNLGRFAWLTEMRTFGELVREAEALEPNTGPWKADTAAHWGENWPIADIGVSADGAHYILTADNIPGTQMLGDADTDVAWIVWCRNNWDQILSALRLAAEGMA